MDSISAERVAAGSARVSSWIPQVFFDLIARVIPGSVGLLLLAVSFLGLSEAVSLVSTLLPKDLGFPTALIILVGMTGASYVYAVTAWGLWYGLIDVLQKSGRIDKRRDTETLVLVLGQKFPDLYEKIKTNNPVAGNRLTKLKAEIHMTGTPIISSVAALIIFFIEHSFLGNKNSWYFIIFILLALLGLAKVLKHFVRRSTQIVNNSETICHK